MHWKSAFFTQICPNSPQFLPKISEYWTGKTSNFDDSHPKKKKWYFFIILKNDIFAPFRPIFCPISPPLERIRQKKWSFASGFRGPKIGLFSPHFLPLFTAEGPKRGKKGSENFGWETPKNPILTEGLQEGIFLGWKKAFLGGPFFARFRARKTRWENGDFGGFCPNFGGRGWKKMGVLRKRPQNVGGIWGNLGKIGGKMGKIGGETEKMVKNGGNDPKMRGIGSKSGRIGWSRLKMW